MKSDPRARLLELLHEKSIVQESVTLLASGRVSDFFVDCKQAVLTAEGHALVGELLFDKILSFDCDAVAGVELGGCALASAVSLTSYLRGAPKDAIYVRKERKDHGSKRLLEGKVSTNTAVVVLEDVITTGSSALKAVECLNMAGHRVMGIVSLVDRLEGGRANIEAAGLPLFSIFTRFDFTPKGY